eukprot:gnl/MRDRNA2_/MRDRNA2_34824_c0_seq1.p1 gnl/MRDRNA2_/MRDRNA2_34824_c0~~gnl/MRDRNA2_/MRDRNA2_34824_c0_seq1.p1  ORF type:complete len:267 (+),score=33.54 gnl/MRDRNA2_/MRDRNA2_34824_c0_seq1:88-801(+)
MAITPSGASVMSPVHIPNAEKAFDAMFKKSPRGTRTAFLTIPEISKPQEPFSHGPDEGETGRFHAATWQNLVPHDFRSMSAASLGSRAQQEKKMENIQNQMSEPKAIIQEDGRVEEKRPENIQEHLSEPKAIIQKEEKVEDLIANHNETQIEAIKKDICSGGERKRKQNNIGCVLLSEQECASGIYWQRCPQTCRWHTQMQPCNQWKGKRKKAKLCHPGDIVNVCCSNEQPATCMSS